MYTYHSVSKHRTKLSQLIRRAATLKYVEAHRINKLLLDIRHCMNEDIKAYVYIYNTILSLYNFIRILLMVEDKA